MPRNSWMPAKICLNCKTALHEGMMASAVICCDTELLAENRFFGNYSEVRDNDVCLRRIYFIFFFNFHMEMILLAYKRKKKKI